MKQSSEIDWQSWDSNVGIVTESSDHTYYLLLNLGNNVNTGMKVSPALECRKHSIVT